MPHTHQAMFYPELYFQPHLKKKKTHIIEITVILLQIHFSVQLKINQSSSHKVLIVKFILPIAKVFI